MTRLTAAASPDRAGPCQQSWSSTLRLTFGACPPLLQVLPDQRGCPVRLLQQLPADRRGRIWRHVELNKEGFMTSLALFMVSVTENATAGCVISQSSQFFRGAL